jgi:hypothetical protein
MQISLSLDEPRQEMLTGWDFFSVGDLEIPQKRRREETYQES